MDKFKRDEVIGRYEDIGLDNYLDSMYYRSNLCCDCGEIVATMEFNGDGICDQCYEDRLDLEAIRRLDEN